MLFTRWSAGKPIFVLVVMESPLCRFTDRSARVHAVCAGLGPIVWIAFSLLVTGASRALQERVGPHARGESSPFSRPRVFSDFCMINYTRRKGVFSGRARNGGREGTAIESMARTAVAHGGPFQRSCFNFASRVISACVLDRPREGGLHRREPLVGSEGADLVRVDAFPPVTLLFTLAGLGDGTASA